MQADKGVDVLNYLRIEFYRVFAGAVWSAGFAVGLYRRCICCLGCSTDLISRLMGAFCGGLSLFWAISGDGAVAGQVLDMVSFVLGQLCVAHGNLSCRKGRIAAAYRPFSVMESCTSNANPPSSENFELAPNLGHS